MEMNQKYNKLFPFVMQAVASTFIAPTTEDFQKIECGQRCCRLPSVPLVVTPSSPLLR